MGWKTKQLRSFFPIGACKQIKRGNGAIDRNGWTPLRGCPYRNFNRAGSWLRIARRWYPMLDLCRLIFGIAGDLLRSQVALRPETVIRWHRAGFSSYWRWKSNRRCGRPAVTVEMRQPIRQISGANPLWGAPRIHGELLKLGIDVGQTSVAEYMVRTRVPPSQGWRTFLRNHADGIAAMDLFVVPTSSSRLLDGLLIMGHCRRHLLWVGVTAHPRAEWIANQLTEACGWEQIPRYLIRDHDGAYGEIFIRRVRSIGTHDEAFVVDKIIGMLRRSPGRQIGWGCAHDPPVLDEALDAQGAVRQLAISDGEVLSLADQVDVAVREVEIDGHFRVLGQEGIKDRNERASAEINRRAQPDRPRYLLHS
jgi:hypothetical protein